MKFLILIVLVILVAPNIARHFSPTEEAGPRRGPMYRLARRYGLRTLAMAMILGLVAASMVLYLLVRRG